jgi:iron complex transport system ATP-binding protein
MNQNLLCFNEVSYRYPGNRQNTLEQLNFRVTPGKVTAVLGPNGAGKSTLLRLAYGRLQPISGEILLAGQPLSAYPRPDIGKQIALVPQKETSPFDYTLLEYVLMGRAPHLSPLAIPGLPDFRIAENALATVGLVNQSQRLIHTLSGGEFQLILIARALTQQPRLLLLDEPTAHLDLANKKHLVDLLKELTRQGVTILMTSHDPEVVSALADQALLLSHGQTVYAGTLEQVWKEELLSTAYGVALRVKDMDGRKWLVWDN